MRILMISAEGPPLTRATGEILEAVETRQLEGMLANRDQALEWVKLEYALSEGEGKRPTSNVERPTSN